MNQNSKPVVQTVTIPNGSTLAISTPEETIICDVCGAENSAERVLCRVCSNYLTEEDTYEDEEEF